MKQILPLVIGCCVGIALCVGYIVVLLIKLKRQGGFKKDGREEFEIDDNDVLTIHLDDKH